MKALPGIIVGLAAGTVLGLLLAPQSGKKTRRMMGHESGGFFSDLQHQLQLGMEKARDQCNNGMGMGMSKAKEAAETVEHNA